MTYGDADQPLTATADSGLTVSFSSQTTGVCTVIGSSAHIVSSGTCTIEATQVGNGTYGAATPVDKSFSIAKATPTLSVTNSPTTYDGSAHAAVVSGSTAGSASNVLTGGAATQTDASTYAVTANFTPTDTADYNSLTAASAGNFVISSASQTITVGTPAPGSAMYGSTFSVAATAPGGAVAITTDGSVCTGSGSGSAVITMASGTGTCNVYYNQAGTSDYNAAPQIDEMVSAQKANATINVSGYSGTYDGVAHGASGTATGVNHEDLSGELDFGSSFTDVSGGTANWTFSGDSDYSSANGSVAITISPETIYVTTDAAGKMYGDTDPGLTYGYTGTLYDAASFSGALTRNVGEDVGDYAITQGTLSLPSDYALDFTGNTFTISQKQFLTVTADPQTITYGDPDPTFTFQYSGFVNGDDAGAVGTPPTCSVAGAHSAADSYDIVCSGGSATNYDFAYVSAELTVNKADADCSSITGYSTTYNGTAQTATGVCKGVDGGTLDGLDLSGTTQTDAGTYTAAPWTFTDTSGNYNNTSGTVDDSIAKATLTVTPDAQYVTVGDGAPNYTFTVDGFQNGEDSDTAAGYSAPSCTSDYTDSTPVEDSPLTITCSGGTADNYTFDTSATAGLTISATPITTYTLTYTTDGNGTISGDSPQTIEEGADGSAVTAVPNDGYHFVNWSDESTDNPRTDTNVTGDISVTANFAANGGGNNDNNQQVQNNGAISPVFVAPPSNPAPNAGGQVLGASAYNFTKNLWHYETDPDVAQLQTFLVAEGYSIPDAVTNYFGPETFAAVKQFQADNGIPSTGFVGPLTRALLNQGIVPKSD